MAGRERANGITRLSRRPLVLSACLLLAVLFALPEASLAQQRPATIVDMLFGGGNRLNAPQEREPAARARPSRKKPEAQRRSNTRAATRPARERTRSATRPRSANPTRSSASTGAAAATGGAAAAATPEGTAPADKTSNARTILVVGDFLADSLADGLRDLYADDAGIAVTARANGSSGLVREDYYDWGEKLGPLIDEVEPVVVAVMLGSNDRQPLRLSGATLSVRSDGWTAEYEKRATDIARIAEEKKVPLIWVGTPSFKYDSMSEDMIFFNDIYRRAAERVGGTYVDIWDGFVDANGDFVYSGPDVNGQTAKLRGSDGINMTAAGDEKLAFFAEKALARVLGEATPEIAALSADEAASMQLPPLGNAASAKVAAPVSLSDPNFDGGGDQLMGTGSPTTLALDISPRDRLVLNGDTGTRPAGRADAFSWNDKSGAVRRDTAPVAYRGSIDLQTVRQESGIKPPKEMPTILDAIIEDWQTSGQESAPPESGTQ